MKGRRIFPDRRVNDMPEYRVWRGMLARCYVASSDSYQLYGARGIVVCDRWHSFENFLADMAPRPSGMSIDRIDNNGNYEPGNCRWVTPAQQSRNQRTNRILTLNGESMTQQDWAVRIGINAQTIQKRLKLGWSVEKALTTPRLQASTRKQKAQNTPL